ncbi:MAG: methionine--tRNA ligase [Saprospiraceae bacterium]|nr:methionine--tRNA ligase [Saprospiraceae bacterium]
MANHKRTLITSALPYANGPLHIGHLAGAYINADIYARFLRAKGEEVVFVCGSDEHGAAITIRAKLDGITPQEVVEKYHTTIKKAFDDFGISFDIYHRTSEPLHHETSQAFFKQLNATNKFIQKESQQYYDPEAEQFLADRYIKGTCPVCGNEDAYGDQCERCGSSLSPTELINPKSTLSNATPELRATSHWYFPLNDYEAWLKEWILEDHPNWKKNVYGQCKSWLENGLQPRAMTRDLDWGVKVPVEGANGKVLYVWLDAPIGYISATKQWAADHGKNWEDYWKSEDSRLLHFIGKDNIVFHCIIFPSLLKAHGGFVLPENVPANEFMNLEGRKISTSKNWAIWLHEYLEDLPGKEDELRYVLMANMPETKDSEFTWKDYQTRVNSELVATLGNFVNRVVVLTNKYFEGEVQAITGAELNEVDNNAVKELAEFAGKIDADLEEFRFRDALSTMMDIARLGNKYLGDREPWQLIKTNEAATANVLNIGLQIAANLAIAMQPFLPKAAGRLVAMLNLSETNWNQIGQAFVPGGHQIEKGGHLFSKIEDAVIEAQIQKLQGSIQEETPEVELKHPLKSTIEFDDFVKIDLRVGTICAATPVPKTDKLLMFTVDMGFEERTIISGVAKHFTPEDCVGKQVCVVANLAPRKMRGVESQGMILFAEDDEGKLIFVSPQAGTQNGSVVA